METAPKDFTDDAALIQELMSALQEAYAENDRLRQGIDMRDAERHTLLKASTRALGVAEETADVDIGGVHMALHRISLPQYDGEGRITRIITRTARRFPEEAK